MPLLHKRFGRCAQPRIIEEQGKKQIIQFYEILMNRISFYSQYGYSFHNYSIYNEGSIESWARFQFFNEALDIQLIYDFSPSGHPIVSSEINVIVCRKNECIGLKEFLAFRQLNRCLTYEDIIPFRFKLSQQDIEGAIKSKLAEIESKLTIEMKSVFYGEQWIRIRIEDLRDKY